LQNIFLIKASYNNVYKTGDNVIKLFLFVTYGKTKYTKILFVLANFKAILIFEIKVWDCIHNTSFPSKLMNGPDKLECYITLGWKGSPVERH
jgi:hypothetical protein